MKDRKKIVVGITGSIAAYKACELVRSLISGGFEVLVVVTQNALQFVTPLTLKTLSGRHVVKDMFDEIEFSGINHISVAHWADLLIICPATANILGKAACGIADDVLSTLILSTKKPIVFAPAMNANMYENKILQRNLETLRRAGCYMIEPETGYLACGDEGVGRLASIDKIVSIVNDIISSST